MNGYAVQDAWKKHEAAQRKAAAEMARAAERSDLAEKIRESMPDMVDETGRVCDFAIYAALMLKRRGEQITPRAIRDQRAKHNLGDRTVAQAEQEGWE